MDSAMRWIHLNVGKNNLEWRFRMKTLIHTGKLIGMVGNKVDKDVSVLINNGRFEKIGPQGSIAANGTREVDAA